jgi:hypothetical protein
VFKPATVPAQPAFARTVYVRPAVWLAVLSVVTDGAVTVMPVPTEPKVTTSVALPVKGVTGLTTTFTAVLGPVVVLQVSVTVAGVAVRRSTADTGRVVATIPAISHKADRLA